MSTYYVKKPHSMRGTCAVCLKSTKTGDHSKCGEKLRKEHEAKRSRQFGKSKTLGAARAKKGGDFFANLEKHQE